MNVPVLTRSVTSCCLWFTLAAGTGTAATVPEFRVVVGCGLSVRCAAVDYGEIPGPVDSEDRDDPSRFSPPSMLGWSGGMPMIEIVVYGRGSNSPSSNEFGVVYLPESREQGRTPDMPPIATSSSWPMAPGIAVAQDRTPLLQNVPVAGWWSADRGASALSVPEAAAAWLVAAGLAALWSRHELRSRRSRR